MNDCNEWSTEKCHECTIMGKVQQLELWWQLHVTSLPVQDLENFRPLDFFAQRVQLKPNISAASCTSILRWQGLENAPTLVHPLLESLSISDWQQQSKLQKPVVQMYSRRWPESKRCFWMPYTFIKILQNWMKLFVWTPYTISWNMSLVIYNEVRQWKYTYTYMEEVKSVIP